jgi:hypothetical protein
MFLRSEYPAALPAPIPHIPSAFPSITPSPLSDSSPYETHNERTLHLRHTINQIISENGANIHEVINYEIYKVSFVIFGVLLASLLIMFMLNYMVHKYKDAQMYPHLDKEHKHTIKIKAKQSPYIEPMPDSPILPRSLSLDSAEKGQNVLLRYSGPYRRVVNTNSDGFVPEKRNESGQETRITILVD